MKSEKYISTHNIYEQNSRLYWKNAAYRPGIFEAVRQLLAIITII